MLTYTVCSKLLAGLLYVYIYIVINQFGSELRQIKLRHHFTVHKISNR